MKLKLKTLRKRHAKLPNERPNKRIRDDSAPVEPVVIKSPSRRYERPR